ncbi:MAG: hypothetical protein LBD37_05825 [Treponema sp.]|jgi:hypothetical protein|nr:hypothetical protein [Treponema sp.]
MGGAADWRNVTYEETLEEELRAISRRREADRSCTVADLEGVLANLYQVEGADWGGRGEVQEAALSATIAAYELAIAQWKAEPSPHGQQEKG